MANVANSLGEAGYVPVRVVEGAVRHIPEARLVPKLLIIPAFAEILRAGAGTVLCTRVEGAELRAGEVALAPEEFGHEENVGEQILIGGDVVFVLQPQVEVFLLLF